MSRKPRSHLFIHLRVPDGPKHFCHSGFKTPCNKYTNTHLWAATARRNSDERQLRHVLMQMIIIAVDPCKVMLVSWKTRKGPPGFVPPFLHHRRPISSQPARLLDREQSKAHKADWSTMELCSKIRAKVSQPSYLHLWGSILRTISSSYQFVTN